MSLDQTVQVTRTVINYQSLAVVIVKTAVLGLLLLKVSRGIWKPLLSLLNVLMHCAVGLRDGNMSRAKFELKNYAQRYRSFLVLMASVALLAVYVYASSERNDYYAILGVSPNADLEGIEAAYKAKMATTDESDLQAVRTSYEILSNELQRSIFDYCGSVCVESYRLPEHRGFYKLLRNWAARVLQWCLDHQIVLQERTVLSRIENFVILMSQPVTGRPGSIESPEKAFYNSWLGFLFLHVISFLHHTNRLYIKMVRLIYPATGTV